MKLEIKPTIIDNEWTFFLDGVQEYLWVTNNSGGDLRIQNGVTYDVEGRYPVYLRVLLGLKYVVKD